MNAYAFIHKLHREELPIPSGVTPCADGTLVGDSDSNSPSEKNNTLLLIMAAQYLMWHATVNCIGKKNIQGSEI